MPVLSINFGISTVRGVYLDDSGSVSSHVFRYPYSEDLYSHFYSEKDFYSDVVTVLLKELNAPKEGVKIIATGFPEVPAIRYEYASSVLFDQLVKQVDTHEVVSITDSTVFTQNKYSSHYDIEKLQYGKNEKNYLLNLALYSNALPEKPSEYNLILANIWNMLNTLRTDSKTTVMSTRPTLFMGDVFDTENPEFEKIAYLYILSFIVNPGVSYVALDKQADLVHLAHFKHYNREFSDLYDSFKPLNLGTLINSPGDTSCLIQNENSTNQLIEVKAGKIFFIPLGENADTRVLVKGKLLGNVERSVKGGKLGLIIDTRSKQDKSSYDYNQLQVDINSNLKSINEVLRRI